MTKHLKKITAAILTIVLALSTSTAAIAATQETWGPHWYTPTHGRAVFQTTYVAGFNLKWLQSSLNQYLADVYYWELEFRPCLNGSYVPTTNIYNVNAGGNFVTNLPMSYYEYSTSDTEDISFGCADCSLLNASTTYYGNINLTPKSGVSTNYQAVVESEYGLWLNTDGLPLRYEQHGTAPFLNHFIEW